MVISGEIKNFATEEDIQLWTTVLRGTKNPITVKQNDCHGVGEDHRLYDWFLTKCFDKIKVAIGNHKLKVMFGMYLHETNPWGIHTDSYHVKDYPNRETAISFLIPLSVDNNEALVSKSHTIVFNESGNDIRFDEHNNFLDKIVTDSKNIENTASKIYDQHLSHNTIEKVNQFTVNNILQWNRGSLIWWHGRYFHDSDNFIANGFKSKQAIVVHTYYDC